jgi:hypothetical protein
MAWRLKKITLPFSGAESYGKLLRKVTVIRQTQRKTKMPSLMILRVRIFEGDF